MKTATRNISLHEDLADYALQKAEEGCYGSVSSYFAQLLRERRQAEIDADVKFLAAAMKGAPPGPDPVREIVAAVKSTRRKLLRQKRPENISQLAAKAALIARPAITGIPAALPLPT